MQKKWMARSVLNSDVDCIPDNYPDMPKSVALLLARRCMTLSEVEKYLNPMAYESADWKQLATAEKAVERIRKAIHKNQRILVYGDYDADGVTATALMCSTLKDLGGNVEYHIPDRFADGYGLGKNGVNLCIERKINLVITVDCGTTAYDQVNILSGAGIETVVTDHHEAGDKVANAYAIVNPRLNRDRTGLDDLSGVGVAFKVVQGLYESFTGSSDEAEKLVDLVAIGTICDIVPLSGENRSLVTRGLRKLRNQPNTGVKELAKVAGISCGDISSAQIAFVIGPRLNACGRVGNAGWGVELLLTEDEGRAAELASIIDQNNFLRRQLDRLVQREAEELAENQKDRHTLVIAKNNWHQGVLGIAASRLVHKFGKPTVLISLSDDPARGSARSIEGFEVHSVLTSVSDLLESYGGHPLAAGLSIKQENVDLFSRKFEEIAGEILGENLLLPILYVDGKLEIEDYNLEVVNFLKKMEPFGEGNEEPVWIARNVRAVSCNLVGGGRHLKAGFRFGGRFVDSVGFGMSEKQSIMDSEVDLAFVLKNNTYNGRSRLQLHLRDIRPSVKGFNLPGTGTGQAGY